MSKKNSNDTIGNRTCDLPACSYCLPPLYHMFGIQNPQPCLSLLFLFLFLSTVDYNYLLSSTCCLHPLSWELHGHLLACGNFSIYAGPYRSYICRVFKNILFKFACKIGVLGSHLCYPLICNSYIVSTISQLHFSIIVYIWFTFTIVDFWTQFHQMSCKFLFVQNYLEVNGKEFECCRFILRFPW